MRGRRAAALGSCTTLVLGAAFGCATSYGPSEATPASNADGGDASSSGDASVEDRPDAGDADTGARCDPTKPFGEAREVSGLATPSHEGSARLLPDELTAFFHAVRGDAGDTDLFVATRGATSEPFAGVTRLQGPSSSTYSDNHPSPSGGGLGIVFARQVGEWSLYQAARADLASPFNDAAAVDVMLPGDDGSLQPYLVAGALYYSGYSNASGGRTKIRRAPVVGPGSFGTPVAVPELDSSDIECNPTVTPDELTIYFCSNRPAAGAKGKFDIYVARRATSNEPFSQIKNVAELNTTEQEYPDWISPDGCRLYFTSDRVRGDGTGDVFVAERGR